MKRMHAWRPPSVLPAGWHKSHQAEHNGDLQVGYQDRIGRLFVLIDSSRKADGRRWIHLSVSHPERLPRYSELQDVKKYFIGRDREAVMVFPPEDERVNLHPNCLHLWALEEPVRICPDFRVTEFGLTGI